MAIVNFLHTLDPDGVVLGGGMNFGGNDRPLGRQFLACVQQEARRRAFPILAERVEIDYATLGSDAGYIGAAGLARRKHR
jgi:glucokinase